MIQVNGGVLPLKARYRVSAVRTMGAPSLSGGKVTIADSSTPARVGDLFRAEDGELAGYEIPVLSVSTNSFVIATATLPTNGNTFYLLREVTPRFDSSGSQVASVTLPTYSVVDKARLNYASTSVNDTAYVTLKASTAADAYKMTLFDGGGYAMILATGAASSEVDFMYIPPGGFNGMIDVEIPAGTRLSLKCLEASTTVSLGQIVLNLIG